jgi:hypothetical protein
MIRFAIWAAVSTEAQATADKVSIEVQVEACKKAGESRGWKEATGPYLVKGESRQRWVNLRDAETEIPELHAMLEDAQAGKYDVLIIWDFNRFRDLLDMVSKSLSHYRVQIASVSQWVEPIQPEKYSPYTSDISAIVQVMSKFTSTLQNNDLRRKYMEAMPRRVTQRGLPAGGHVPFGYVRGATSKMPPTIDRDRAQLVLQAKDLLLAGKSTTQIAELLNMTGIAPKSGKWYPQTVKSILTNPFYSGTLRWGVTHSELDPRSGRTHKNRSIPPEKYVIGKGKHEPLWDEYTYHAILSEFHSRGHSYRGRVTQRLTSILTCGVCQQRLWVFYNSSVSPANLVWRCSSREEHVSIRDSDALRLVGQTIINDLMRLDPKEKVFTTSESPLRSELLDLKEQRSRIGDGYAAGAFSIEEFLRRTAPLDSYIADLAHRLDGEERASKDAEARAQAIYYLQENIQHVPAYLENADRQDVNHLLRAVLTDIVVYENRVELRWK